MIRLLYIDNLRDLEVKKKLLMEFEMLFKLIPASSALKNYFCLGSHLFLMVVLSEQT